MNRLKLPVFNIIYLIYNSRVILNNRVILDRRVRKKK